MYTISFEIGNIRMIKGYYGGKCGSRRLQIAYKHMNARDDFFFVPYLLSFYFIRGLPIYINTGSKKVIQMCTKSLRKTIMYI